MLSSATRDADQEIWDQMFAIGRLSSGLHLLQSQRKPEDLLSEINRRAWAILNTDRSRWNHHPRPPLNGTTEGVEFIPNPPKAAKSEITND